MKDHIIIRDRRIGPGYPVYIIAEMSANHNQNFDQAIQIVREAKKAGADAVKLQTYTPDTMTIDCNNEYFQIGRGTIWEGRNLYELYGEAYTPWEWHPKLKKVADEIGIHLFSAPFDHTSVDFLKEMNVPAYKIASFEIVDIPLIQSIARTGKPIIMSTGMASLEEIEEAVRVIQEAGDNELALLKCTSAYPAPINEMNLITIPHLRKTFGLPVGLSDHTIDTVVPVTAVALGACIIEKHLTLSRTFPGPDSAFSLEPHEFKEMVKAVGSAEKALGTVHYNTTEEERTSRVFRKSLFVVQDMTAGEQFTEEKVRSIRPGHGLHTRYLEEILGKYATRNIGRGTPLNWDLVGENGSSNC